MSMKNYVKEGQKLPMFGVGPYLIYGIGALTAAAVILCNYVFRIGISGGIWTWIFRAAGTVMIVFGIAVWFIGAVRSEMDESITENKLKTDGIYAWLRNPMYSGWWFAITGISFMWGNILMIPVFLVNWLIMTVVLKNTEEKWLLDLYGEEYTRYKSSVNRCIPWKRKNSL